MCWLIYLSIVSYCSLFILRWRHNGHVASQITSLTIAYSSVYSGADQRKRSASLALVRGIHRWPENFPHKWPVSRKMFPFDEVIIVCFYILVIFITFKFTPLNDECSRCHWFKIQVFSRRRVCWCWPIAPSVHETSLFFYLSCQLLIYIRVAK